MPADRLLVWNIKEGWEPLCDFLDKPIPAEPIPTNNTTGDKQFMEDYFFKSDLYKKSISFFKVYTCMLLLALLVITAVILIVLQINGIL